MAGIYINGKTLEHLPWSEENLVKAIKRKSFFFLNLVSPTDDDGAILEKHLDLHPITVEDILTKSIRIKLEIFNKYLFMVFDGAEFGRNRIHYHEVKLVLGKHFLVIVHRGSYPLLKELTSKPPHLKALMKKGGDFFIHHIIDREVDNYFPVIDELNDMIEDIENQVFANPEEELLNDIISLKRTLITAKRKVLPLRDQILRLSKGETRFISGEASIYFRDVHDNIIRVSDMIDTYREIIGSTLEAFLTIGNNKLGDVMRVLTVMATIMMPLTVVSGIYGMNFNIMPELEWKYGYFVVLALMGVISGLMIMYFKRKKWL